MASTAPTLARIASRASRLLWMSETTAIRTRSNLAACRSPWPPLARPGVAWVDGWHAPARRRHDEPMAIESIDCDRADLERSTAERVDRASGRDQLGVDVAAFPGDQRAPGLEQRKRQFDELGEACDGAGGDPRPAAPVPAVGRPGLGTDWGRLDRPGQTGRFRDRGQERRLFG